MFKSWGGGGNPNIKNPIILGKGFLQVCLAFLVCLYRIYLKESEDKVFEESVFCWRLSVMAIFKLNLKKLTYDASVP